MPQVSVIMPAYNAQAFISEAVSSVLAQSFRDFELLIWDDGSTDQTVSLCEKWAEEDSRVRVFVSANRGVAHTLNTLLNETSGEFIARMDSDDICYANRLAVQLDYFSNNKALGVLGSKVDLFGATTGCWHYRQTHKQTQALAMLGNTPLCHPSWMVRRDLYAAYRYSPDLEYMEDYGWLARILSETGWQMYATQESLMKYRVHADNVSIHHACKQAELRKRVLTSLWTHSGIIHSQADIDVFCDTLLTGKSYADPDALVESVERIAPQLEKLNSCTASEVASRLKRHQ
ncbi:glycosyltransferase family 2 protein [Alteromonas antoniana]|uniref:glycosyltransferase family 2 protein n=1 Tax=Alteromonas antoniana TaxID=2803813 RepID=UPI001C4367FB|nr:glycosyltransferase [Alteromonas antoniana]